MADVESKFKISAQATGFSTLTKAAEKLTQAFKGLGDAGEAMGQKTTKGLNTQQAALNTIGARLSRLFGGHSAAGYGGGPMVAAQMGTRAPRKPRAAPSPAGPTLVSTGANAAAAIGQPTPGAPPASPPGGGSGGGGGGGSGRTPESPTGKSSFFRNRAKGSFTQGVLQGALPESFIERGPGAYSQAAGVFSGRLARRTLGAGLDLALSAGQGPGAVAGALGGIPLVGGLLSNSLGAGIQAAQGEAAAQAGFAGSMPYLGTGRSSFTDRLNSERRRLGQLGLVFGGLSQNQSLAAFAGAAEQAGGVTSAYGDDRLARAMQARQGYGVDLGTSMRLLRGEDLGQSVGRSSGNVLGQALGNAQGLGLQGAEIGQYLRRIAADMEEVNRTGIKFSAAGQGDLERALGKSIYGASGTRTQELGQSVSAGINQIAMSGPQNSAQSLMLQAAGFNPENPQSYARALRNLEDPTKRADYLRKATQRMRRSTRGFSVDEQAETYRKFMAGLNTNISHTEAYEAIRSKSLDLSQNFDADTMVQPVSDSDLSKRAVLNTPVSAQRSAALANIDTQMGSKQLDSVQTSEENAKRFVAGVQGVGNTFLNAANKIAAIGQQMAHFVLPDAGSSGAETSFR